jgi:hypothetical protein
VGITLVVAPLTSTLMSAVPVHNAGIASAINNAISRVGQPIVAALVFIVISGTFYAALAAATGMDVSDPSLRAAVQPLNAPASTVSPELQAAARIASTQAFHVAALVSAGLLVAGAIVNYVGLGGDRANQATSADAPELGRASSSPDPVAD